MVDQAPAKENAPFLGWLRSGSTPDRLRLFAVVTVLAIVAAGAVAWLLADRLVNDTTEVATSTGEVLIATQQVRASFAEADTAAVSVHLAGADGNREQRRLYERAMDRATDRLEDISRVVGDDPDSHDALQTIAGNTTDYAGLIDAARLASIQDLDQADALLSQASAFNRDEITPEVDEIAERARQRFDDQTSAGWFAVAPVVLAAALVVLMLMQFFLLKRFRRVINVPLALATLLMVIVVFVSGRSFGSQQQAFTQAQDQAFDAIQVSGEIQEIAYQHRALSTSSVLSGVPATDALDAMSLQLTDGLFPQALQQASSAREEASIREVQTRWDRYDGRSKDVQRALGLEGAVAERLEQTTASSAFNGFNTSVEAALLDNREQFLEQLQAASGSLRWLRGIILVGSMLAALLAWWGFGQRIGEYR